MTVYPWIHQHSNNVEAEDATRPTKFPDIDPGLPPDSSFAMVAGDFLEVYADITYHNTFDVSPKLCPLHLRLICQLYFHCFLKGCCHVFFHRLCT